MRRPEVYLHFPDQHTQPVIDGRVLDIIKYDPLLVSVVSFAFKFRALRAFLTGQVLKMAGETDPEFLGSILHEAHYSKLAPSDYFVKLLKLQRQTVEDFHNGRINGFLTETHRSRQRS